MRDKLFALCAVLTCAFAPVLFPQAPPAPTYMATEVQGYRLKVAQDNAIIAGKDLTLARQQLDAATAAAQQSYSALLAEADKVKAENKWPAEVTFNPNVPISDPKKVTFNAPPPKAEPAPAAAKPAPADKPKS